MKKNNYISFVCATIFLVLLIVPAFAADTRASSQISSYSMNVKASKGTLDAEFSVRSMDKMGKIGCESIYVYEQNRTSSTLVDSRTENDAGMSKTNTFNYSNTISFNSKAGAEYRVVVTIFAEDADGRDTRTQTFYVTGQ